ncbi:hypothetical protein CC1G_01650 [Coprinopsis cinerea okayama7|uniref:F-box domain-containing protein n=1 Tax=Coprinopsis cinerea (strain Okayama-7 / 130 / ATCC MYA-4618 / FGSC 9003) TaxID=240176 RepID=A8NID3_COPC7|nr:hypothetical protein CC1G_01650 [Coprinopsis cinerea okayama7\|eukprot:XP_001833973.2 hypothetical protein CC1G_01650 [Coprinopsis cinerea okayama7\
MDRFSETRKLLRSNRPPTETQLDQYRASLEETKEVIKGAERRLEELRELEQDYLRLLSPMRRLTDDVLQEIFRLTQPMDLNQCGDRKMLWTLTAVCWRWRNVAESSATLWNRLYVAGNGNPNDRMWFKDPAHRKKHLRWMNLCIKRSKKAPLYLYLDLGASYTPMDHTVQSDLKAFFEPIAPRLYHLTLISEDMDPILYFPPFTDSTFQELRSILILPVGVNREWADPFRPDSTPFLPNCSHLEVFDIASVGPQFPLLKITSEELRVISVDCRRAGSPSMVLQHWLDLRSASFEKIEAGLGREDPPPMTRLTAPHLASLTLGFCEGVDPATVLRPFKGFRLPSLTSRCLKSEGRRFMDGPDWCSDKDFRSVLSQLEELDMGQCPISLDEAKAILQSSPHLRKLCLATIPEFDFRSLMWILTFTDNSSKLVPELEELYTHTRSETVVATYIQRMIRSRTLELPKPSDRRLRKVTVVFPDYFIAHPNDAVECPIDDSVEVELSSTHYGEGLYPWRPTRWNSWRNKVGPRPEGLDENGLRRAARSQLGRSDAGSVLMRVFSPRLYRS